MNYPVCPKKLYIKRRLQILPILEKKKPECIALASDIAKVIEVANEHSSEGKHELAIELLRETLKDHPKNLDVRTTLGIILAKANRDRQSEKMLRSVLRIDPYHEEATSALGRLLDNSLRTQESEQLYRTFLKTRPESYLILTNLARILLEEGRVEEAFSIARRQIEQNPNEVQAYTLLRQLLLLEEIRLEDNVIDSNYDSKTYEFFISNLIEQYDLIKKMDQLFDLNEVESNMIHDEIFRLLGRFEEIQKNISHANGQVSKTALNSIDKVLKELSEYRSMK
jgi:tetratricopeptide (TPR) repeat protein